MTVCVAARSLVAPYVVGVADLRLSFADDSIPATDDATIKQLKLGVEWNAMYAGDPHFAAAIVERAASAKTGESRGEVQSAVQAAYREVLREALTDRYLARYDLTLEQFRRNGRRQFGEALFGKISARIDSFDLDTSLLVVGFSNGWSQLFEVCPPNGHIRDHGALGYWAVGSGSSMALSALAGRPIGGMSLSEMVYRLCEAKFAAETAGGVGQATSVLIAKPGGIASVLWGSETEHLKKIWERQRRHSAPKSATNAVEGYLRHSGVMRA